MRRLFWPTQPTPCVSQPMLKHQVTLNLKLKIRIRELVETAKVVNLKLNYNRDPWTFMDI
jgi:hypothetical protein